MAGSAKNKYPADKAGSKYSEFRNTKRVSQGKTRDSRQQQSDSSDQSSGKSS